MADQPKQVARHIFVSYPRAYRDVAAELGQQMARAQLRAWIDDVAIEVGTPDWERSIRRAIELAHAVVLVCSPETVASPFVQAELKLAQKHGCPIIPVWVAGDDWVDCVPLGLVNVQYVDCREDRLEAGSEKLVAQLSKIVGEGLQPLFVVDTFEDCPPGFIRILMPKNDDKPLSVREAGHVTDWARPFGEPLRRTLQIVVADPDVYDSLEPLLDDLYTRYLRHRYDKYTYGRDWVLARASTYVTLFALPLEWLRYKRDRLLVDVLPDFFERRTPLKTFGVKRAHGRAEIWAIVDGDFDPSFAVCTSSDTVADSVFDQHPKSLAFNLERWTRVGGTARAVSVRTSFVDLEQIDPENFKYRVLVQPEHFRGLIAGQALVIQDAPDLDDES